MASAPFSALLLGARLSTANVFVLEKTFESSSVCESIQDYLLKRLSTDSAAVKLKTLRVTKCTPCFVADLTRADLIDKGNRHFKRDLTRRVDVLRDAACTPLPPSSPLSLEQRIAVLPTPSEAMPRTG